MAIRGMAAVRRSAVVGGLVVGLCAAGGSATAAPYQDAARISISSTSPSGGSTIAISLTGYQPGEDIDGILLYPTQYAFAVRGDAEGQAALQFVVPESLLCGVKEMRAVGRSSQRSSMATFTVVQNCR